MTEQGQGLNGPEWTPEPWHVIGGLHAIFPDGTTTKELPIFAVEQEHRAAHENCVAGIIPKESDATRIVSCVNFCAGTASERLDMLTQHGGLGKMLDVLQEAMAEMARCKEILAAAGIMLGNMDGKN